MTKRKIAMMLLAFAIFLPCVFALTACGGKDQDNAKVTSISVEFNSVEYELIDNTVTIPYGQKLEFDNEDFTLIAHLDNGQNEEISFKTSSTNGYTLTSTLPTDCVITPRGEYTVTFSYLEFEIVVNVNVVKATIDMTGVEWNYTSAFTYDGNLKEVSVTNLPQGVIVQYSGNTATDAGDYTAIATFTYVDSENYNPIDNMELSWKINPATYVVDEDDITINSYDFTYDATEKEVVLNTTSLDSNVEIEDVVGLSATNAGTHTITITFNYVGTSSNYDRVTPVELTWVIKQANLIITANDTMLVYGSEIPTDASVEYEDFVGDEDESVLTGSLSYEYVDYEVGSPVGNYDIVPSGLTSTNYNITYKKGTLTIDKAELFIIPNNHTIAYNQEPSNNGIIQPGFKAGDTLADLDGELQYTYDYVKGDDVGEYTITVSGVSSNNYNIIYQTGKLTVVKAAIDTVGINLKQRNFVYTGNPITVEIDEATLPAGASVVDLIDNIQTNADDYRVRITLNHEDTKNYNMTVFDLYWSILKADADLSAVDIAVDEFDYTGLTQGVEFTNVPSYAKVGTIANNQAVNAGDYTVEVTFVNADNEEADNYNAFEITKTFDWTINQVKLTITAKDNAIEYLDEAQDNGVEYDGFVNDETNAVLGGELAFDFGEYEVGSEVYQTYTITPYGLTSTNYDIEFIAGTLTVEPKQIDLSEVAWDSEQAQYTYTGEVIRPELVNVPSGVDLTYKYTLVTDSEPQEIAPLNAGEYNVWVQLSPVSGNYQLVNGSTERELTYTINPIEVDLTDVDWAGEREFVYTGEAVKPVLNVETLPYTTIEYAYYLSEGEQVGGAFPSVENPTDAGYYTAWATLTLPDEINYVFTNKNFLDVREYQIVKANIDPTKFAWKETCTKNSGDDIVNDVTIKEGDIYLENDTWRAWGSAILEDNGYIHVLEIVGYENISELDIKYTGDNNTAANDYEGYRLYATITLADHDNYNDFSMVYELGYNLYDNPFTYMAINGNAVTFNEFVNLKYLQVGTVVTFTLRSGYEVPAGRDYIVNDNGMYTMEIKYSTMYNYYLEVATREYMEGSDTEFVYEHVIGVDIKPYILTEIYVNNQSCETIYNYGHTITLDYNQDSILVDFDNGTFEKYEFYYTIQKMDESYETFKIESLPLTIPNATNIKNFTISYNNNGNNEMVQTFDIWQFTPVEEYVINKERFSEPETELADPYINSINVYGGIVTSFTVEMKDGFEDWTYALYVDEELTTSVNWLDLDSHDTIYIAIYDAEGTLFEIREMTITYRFWSTNSTIGNDNHFELNINEENEQEFVFNDEDGIVSVGYEVVNENLVVSSTINGEEEFTLTQDITNATYRIEMTYNGNVYFVERQFTIFKAVSYQDTVGNITFTDNDNNTFYIENNTLYISDMEVLEDNLHKLNFENVFEGYEVDATEIVEFEGETYIKVTLNYTDPNQDTGSGDNTENGETTEGDGTEGDNSSTEDNGDTSGSGDLVIDGGFGNITLQNGYNATSGTGNKVYVYIRVCVNEEFNTDTEAIVKVNNYENNQETWYTSNEYPIVIANRYSSALTIEIENYYAKVVITDAKGNVVQPMMDHHYYMFDYDGVYTLSIQALKGDPILYTINVGDITGGDSGDIEDNPITLFEVVVGEQTLVQQQVENSAPYGDFEFVQNSDLAEFSVELNQSAWNYVSGEYLTIASLTSPYLQYGAVVTDCNGNVINNLNNYNLLIQTTEGGKSYVYFAVTITNNDEVMGAEFYLYLTNQAGDNTGEGVELFTVVVGNQTLIQRQVGDNAPTGDFMFEDTGDGFMFMAYLNESALSCVDNGYLTITSISSSYFGANTQLTITDPSGSTISGATNFKLQLRGDGTSSGVAFIATISDGENEMSAIIALALPTSSGGDDNYDDTTNAGYYDEYISIHVEGMYGTSMDFEVNDGVINFTDWSILYCLEATVMRPDVCVQLLDSNQNELTGDPQRGVVYCFQNAGTYTLNVYNAEGEIVETFTINVNGNFDKTVVTVEFGELTLTETCDETWEPVGDFVYTMDMSTQEAYIINFKGYLGAEALESARVSMKGMPIITLDSIDSIFADSLYYDASGLNQIAELQNVELEGTQDAYGNYYVSFYIINEWNLGDGYIMDAIMNVSLYLCSRESYLASLDYPLTIGVGTNSLDFRVAMDDIGEFGDFDFDSYYSGVPYIELERSSLNLVADTETSVGGDTSEMPTLEHANVTLTWHKAYQDYSYCVLGMEAFGLLMSEEFTFDELIAEGLIYRCTDLNNNTATIPMTFMDGMAFLMVGLDGLTVENIAEESFAIVLFLIKGEATLEDFENMMNDDSMGGGVELSIPDIEITVGKQILTTQNGDFMINYENGELVGWLDCTYDEIVQIGDNGNYINLDSIVVSEECELRDGYERSLNFTNAQVAVFGFEYGLCAEIRVYSQNGSSFRILLVVDNSVSDDTVGGDDNNNVQMTFTSLPTDIELEIVVGSQTLTADDFDYCQEYNLIVGRLNSTEQQLVSDGYATITSLTTNLEGRVIDANSDEIDLSGSFEVCSADTGIMGVALIIGIQRNQTIYTIFLLFAEEDKNSTSSGVTIG